MSLTQSPTPRTQSPTPRTQSLILSRVKMNAAVGRRHVCLSQRPSKDAGGRTTCRRHDPFARHNGRRTRQRVNKTAGDDEVRENASGGETAGEDEDEGEFLSSLSHSVTRSLTHSHHHHLKALIYSAAVLASSPARC